MPTRAWFRQFLARPSRGLECKVIPEWEAQLAPAADKALRQMAAYPSQEALFFNALSGPKSGFAPGALDPGERSAVLDALNIGSQTLLSTFIAPRVLSGALARDEVRIVIDAHNRAIHAFAEQDARLRPVGMVSFEDPDFAVEAVKSCAALGVRLLQAPIDAANGRAPTHPDFEPFWRLCHDLSMGIIVHIGGGELMPAIYHRAGASRGHEPAGAEGTLPPKDFAVLHHGVERFLACMILDGVLQRYPGLMIGVLEHGASWLPGFLRQMDRVARHFRSDPSLARLTELPSETIRRHVRVAPLFFEDVGQLTRDLGPSMLMFSTDFPHFEGGADPVGRFEASFDASAITREDRRRFYRDNCHELQRAS